MSFPPGRDPAVFKVTGLPGEPDVEVTAEDDGSGRLPLHRPHHGGGRQGHRPAPGARPAPGPVRRRHLTATWDGIEIEWHYQPPDEQPADPARCAALLAHLAVLGRP